MNGRTSRPSREALEGFFRGWPYKPHRWRTNPAECDELFVERMMALIDRAAGTLWTTSAGGRVAGLAFLEPLEWDTRILRMRAARLHLAADRASAAALIDDAMREARRDRTRHVSARVDAEDDAAIQGLEALGFLNVDALMTFAATPGTVIERGTSAVEIRTASADDVEMLGEIASATFVHGRFHADPSISPHTAREVYRAWTIACCEGTAADTVLIAKENNVIAGFVACRMQADTGRHAELAAGTIPLIASTTTHRSRGIGSALLVAAARWFSAGGAATIEVGTQLRDVAAARLYERMGFRLISGALSFRKMIE